MSRFSRYVKGVNSLIYLLIGTFTVLEFVVLHVYPLYFYFLTLAIAVPTLILYPKYIKIIFLMMIEFVIVGTVLYFLFYMPSTTLSIFITQIGNNFSGIGYYLLIDLLIAFTAYAIIQNYSFERRINKFKRFIEGNSDKLSYLLLIIAVILIVGPFWPGKLIYQTTYHSYISSYNASLGNNFSSTATMHVPADYMIIPICSEGANTSFRVNFTASEPAMGFIMRNYSSLEKLKTVTPGYVEANASVVTALGTKESLSFNAPGNCAEFGILSEQDNSFIFNIGMKFAGIKYTSTQTPYGAPTGAETGSIISSIIYVKNIVESKIGGAR